MKIVLTGFMATGKTSTGKVLAQKLNLDFYDTDALIEERAGRSIPEIFSKEGEPSFRALEKEVIAEVADKDNVVIATGGGAVMDLENRARLKKNGILIALMASSEEVKKRIERSSPCRPLLSGKDKERAIKELLKERLPVYRQSDICIDTTGKSSEEVAQEIIKELSQRRALTVNRKRK